MMMCTNVSRTSRITLMPSKIAGILSANEGFKSLSAGHEIVSILLLTVKLLNLKMLNVRQYCIWIPSADMLNKFSVRNHIKSVPLPVCHRPLWH